MIILMCVEGNPYRCHRRLVADALVIRGIRVVYISALRSSRSHTLISFTRVDDGNLCYPASEGNNTELTDWQDVLE